MGLKCGDCGYILMPPRGICPKCGSYDLSWMQLSRKGKLLFATVGRHRLMGIEYILGTVKLEEGPIIPGMVIIEDFDYSKPEKIWKYNQANIPVMAQVIQNPEGAESIVFKVIQ